MDRVTSSTLPRHSRVVVAVSDSVFIYLSAPLREEMEIFAFVFVAFFIRLAYDFLNIV